MRQYFTFRPIVLNYVYTPKYSFQHELNTIKWLKYRFVCQKKWDNRQLAYWEYEWDIPEKEIKTIIKETLAKYSYHPKTLKKAKEFIKDCFGDRLEKISVEKWKIIFIIKEINNLSSNQK